MAEKIVRNTSANGEREEPKLPDQVADAWAAVLIDIYQRLKQREDAKPKDGEGK